MATIGRPRVRPFLIGTCEHCKSTWVYVYPGWVRRFCSMACKVAHMSVVPMRGYTLPNDPETYRHLYWTENMTTVEIAELFDVDHTSVVAAMRRLGVPRRGRGYSRIIQCVEPGCDAPAEKRRHPINGSYYGTRCEPHRIAHRHHLSDVYRSRELPPEWQPAGIAHKRTRRTLRILIQGPSQSARGEVR